jgi:hypothetical protein
MVMDRDINGAKNIFLKNHEALALELTLGPTPCGPATGRCMEAVERLPLLFENREVFEV